MSAVHNEARTRTATRLPDKGRFIRSHLLSTLSGRHAHEWPRARARTRALTHKYRDGKKRRQETPPERKNKIQRERRFSGAGSRGVNFPLAEQRNRAIRGSSRSHPFNSGVNSSAHCASHCLKRSYHILCCCRCPDLPFLRCGVGNPGAGGKTTARPALKSAMRLGARTEDPLSKGGRHAREA